MSGTRQAELKRILESRRSEIEHDLHARVNRGRYSATSAEVGDVVDMAESAEVDLQEELGFALMQMKAETLERTNDALRRLEAGTFGVCAACGDDIPEARLRALPFAVRCTECEKTRERATGSSRNLAPRFTRAAFELQ
jgi:DnaK suppressor protein